jgi:glutathione S-transferase
VITFYYGSGSAPAWRVWLALEHKQLPYEFKLMSFSAGDLKTPAYRALNPRGQVPLIVDQGFAAEGGVAARGGFALWESNAIVEYLEEQYPATPRLFPGSTRERSAVRRWVSEIDDNFGAALAKLTGWVLWTPKDQWKEDRIADARQAVLDELETIAGHMGSAGNGDGEFLARNTLTAADFALYPMAATLARCDLKKPDLKMMASRPAKIAAWAKRIEALPYFEKTVPPHWKE